MPRLTAGRAISVFTSARPWEIRKLNLVARVPPGPAQDRKIGDRQRACDKLMIRKPTIQHAIEPSRLRHVALQAIGALLFILQCDEVVHLPRHRSEAAHLPHQPFIDRDPIDQGLGQEFAGLLAEIEQDRAGLEYADGLATRTIRIDDRGNLVVGLIARNAGAICSPLAMFTGNTL